MNLYLSCNPHFYDYLHIIKLKEDKTCNFVDGAGQHINNDLKGTYSYVPISKKEENLYLILIIRNLKVIIILKKIFVLIDEIV